MKLCSFDDQEHGISKSIKCIKKNQMQLQKGFKPIVLEFTITTGYFLAQTSSVVEQSSRKINDISKTR